MIRMALITFFGTILSYIPPTTADFANTAGLLLRRMILFVF